ncbi:MAG: hypothetical protein J6W88_02020 [Bacteroidales bacterium]|nr:hypothetical protein [Bacteroidales bacterium]
MNNTFDWNRFCKVVNKDFRNMWPLFGPTMIILAALPFAIWLLLFVVDRHNTMPADFRLLIIEGVACVAAIMAPSRMYRTWNLRNEGIYYAMLPASKLEKYCSALLFSLIICPLTVFLGGMALDIVLTALPFGPWRDWLWQGDMGFPFTFDFSSMVNDYSVETAEFREAMHFGALFMANSWLGYIASVLMFMFTSTLFKRHKVLQTILWIYAIEFVLSLVLIPTMMTLSRGDSLLWLVDWLQQHEPETVMNMLLWFGVATDAILIALFGWLTWRRLKKMPY